MTVIGALSSFRELGEMSPHKRASPVVLSMADDTRNPAEHIRRLDHSQLRQLLVEQSSMDSEAASSVRLVAEGRFQSLFDEVTLPACDSFMKRQLSDERNIESALPGRLCLCQFILNMFGGDGSSAGFHSSPFDQ